MTTTPTSVVAALRRLAEAEEACPGGGPEICAPAQPGDKGHGDCSGTGRVLLFRDGNGQALFRRACTVRVLDAHDVQYGFGDRHHPDKCDICNGLGWLPLDVGKVTLELCLAVARSRGWRIDIHQYEKRTLIWVHQNPRNLAYKTCDPGEEKGAAILALDEAVTAQKGAT